MIKAIEIKNHNGLSTVGAIKTEQVVLLAGKNGAGKSRLLNSIVDKFGGKKVGGTLELYFGSGDFQSNKSKHKICNYSHYDILLQSPKDFIPEVIAGAEKRLKNCSYEDTATDALLFIYDMAFGYSDFCKEHKELFSSFKEYAQEKFELVIEKDEKNKSLTICNDDGTDSRSMSPGQRYLLRMAVACFRKQLCDKEQKSQEETVPDPNYIFIIDEPEIHLHPDAMIKTLDILIENFGDSAQFFIATHSLALISHFVVSATVGRSANILWFENGHISDFRSDSTKLVSGLIGDENNRLAIDNLICLPDDFACNTFASQCLDHADAVSVTNKAKQDKSCAAASAVLDGETSGKIAVLDYGVGKGRFLESLSIFEPDKVEKIDYYAYDKFASDSDICKKIMSDCFGGTDDFNIDGHYSNDFADLRTNKTKFDYVFMINVLHEISVKDWSETFDNINAVLSANGRLVIVERKELTVGESPYLNGYVMLTEGGARSLFGGAIDEDLSKVKDSIFRCVIRKDGLNRINKNLIIKCLQALQCEAQTSVARIHEKYQCPEEASEAKDGDRKCNQRFRDGISLAFWAHQFTNVSLNLRTYVEPETDRSNIK